ncbi:MAG TPA: hypothetical protein VLH36_06720 [Steroidobacteraceae bacterium]|nr:hypothetical protein [Steroidobacteraceae bacterium]
MAYDSNGVYSLTYTWATEAASPPIAISKLDTEMAGIATGLSLCVLRNGNGVPTADTPWNDKKITGLADATLATDALNRQTADARYGVKSSGNFTIEFATATTGGTVIASGTAYWTKQGNICCVRLPPLTGVTTDTVPYLRGIPADIVPSLTGTYVQTFIVQGMVGGASSPVMISVTETTYWEVVGVVASFDGGSTERGIGGVGGYGPTITYQLSD